MTSHEETLRTMAGLDASRRAAWAQVFELRRRVAELEAGLVGATPAAGAPLARSQLRGGKYSVEVGVSSSSAHVYVEHVESGRILMLTLEPTPENPDHLYGALWIAEGTDTDAEHTYIWDTVVDLSSPRRQEGGWETPEDITGYPGLQGPDDWGRQVELKGRTQDSSIFTPDSPRDVTWITWGSQDGVPFVEVTTDQQGTPGFIRSEMQFVDGTWSGPDE